MASYLKRSKYLVHPSVKVFSPFIVAFLESCCFAFYFLLIPLFIRSLDRKGKNQWKKVASIPSAELPCSLLKTCAGHLLFKSVKTLWYLQAS